MTEPASVSVSGSDTLRLYERRPGLDREAFLRTMPNAILGTSRRDAGPNISPFWFLWTGEEFWFSAVSWVAKVRTLRRDPRATVCIDDPVGGDYVTAYGTCEIVDDDTVEERTIELIRKYRTEPDVLPHWERIKADRVIVVLRPDQWVWRDW